MTPENQRIAIARACDYRPDPKTGLWYLLGDTTLAGFNWAKQRIEPLPDYLNDLNAMHEAEKVLLKEVDARGCPKNFHTYSTNLHKMAPPMNMNPCYAAVRATAPQRAEAFLKTSGLWTED